MKVLAPSLRYTMRHASGDAIARIAVAAGAALDSSAQHSGMTIFRFQPERATRAFASVDLPDQPRAPSVIASEVPVPP
ncbi:MAG TPA: hypothetical protein VMT64_02160, partial [Candidatus Binataceae bacterium]|nr:hypothetical protein [Candidatus Binataceae bacterium]